MPAVRIRADYALSREKGSDAGSLVSRGFLDPYHLEHRRCNQDGLGIRGPLLPIPLESLALCGS